MFCQHSNSVLVLKPKEYLLKECPVCHLIFVQKETSLTPKEIYQDFYEAETGGRFGKPIELIVKIFRFFRALKISFLKLPKKNILDIGSGRGWMLYFLKKYFNYKPTVGLQIADSAFKFSKEKLKLEIFDQDFLELTFPNKFNLITLWHVLEHLEKPEATILKIKETLEPGGYIYLEVPNYNSWSRKLTKTHWLALDLKHHLYFFTPSSLQALLEKYNFKIKKIHTFSLEYSTFTSVQSILNALTNTDSYFFEWLKKRNFELKIFGHLFLFLLLVLPCFFLNFLLYFSRSGEVITVLAQKNES